MSVHVPNWRRTKDLQNPPDDVGKLEYVAFLLATGLATFFLLEHCGTSGMFEDFADAFVGFCRAFQVFVSTDLLADIFGLDRQLSMNGPLCKVAENGREMTIRAARSFYWSLGDILAQE